MVHKKDSYGFRFFESDFLSYMSEGALPEDMLKILRPIKNLKLIDCLEVYSHARVTRLCDTLYENYSACAKVIGDDDFFKICENYVETNSSCSYNLEDYGDTFPSFLRKQSISEDFPFLGDLADFELKFKEVFHAKHEAYDAQSELAKFSDISQLRIGLQATVALLTSAYRIKEIWDLRSSQENEIDWEPLEAPSFLLLYRSSARLYVKELQPMTYEMMSMIEAGNSIGDIMEDISQRFEQPDLQSVQQIFEFLLTNGLIAHIK